MNFYKVFNKKKVILKLKILNFKILKFLRIFLFYFLYIYKDSCVERCPNNYYLDNKLE